MRGFWKTGKELSDRAEISRISSWALGDLNLWISARSDNVKGGLGLTGRNFRPDFPHEGKVGGGWNLAGFLVGARATKCIPLPSLCDHWNRRSLNIVVVRLFKEARVCLLENGCKITTRAGIQDRWKEYFQENLNLPLNTDPEVLQKFTAQIKEEPPQPTLNLEVEAVVKCLNPIKHPG